MPGGRKPKAIKFKTIEASLPETLVQRLNAHLADPITGRRALYDRSQLLEKLIRDYLNKAEGLSLDDLVDSEEEHLEEK